MKTSHLISERFWEPFRLRNQEARGFALGPLRIWVRRDGDDLLGLVFRDGDLKSAVCEPELEGEAPEVGQWRRLGSASASPTVKLLPAMPNRPVVVRPEVPYTILPSEKVQFYVGVPLWIHLKSDKDVLLMEEPVMRLSNTWFGSPMEGELAYAMRTMAKRQVQDLDFHPWRAVCPVRIKNQTKDKLTFERICLRVQYLDLYQDPVGGIWTNDSGVTVRGDDNNWSRISYARGAPDELKSPRLLVNAREEVKGGFSLKALRGAGGMFQ